ncbi:MAG: ABC transporter ATP-binding protein [Acidobacteria bacterium]|nr:ABC transporter ATP-binding protein [Acidobacteriota bacterium]
MSIRIQADNISFSYSQDRAIPVFRNVSFSVRSGEVFCLLGPNGTGKSTLLKCLDGVLRIQHGRITVGGKDLFDYRVSEIARTIGYVPQGLMSAFPFRIKDIVVMGRAPHLSVLASPSRHDMEIAYRAMERVGVIHLAERSCISVSGGEWQLALIARALVQEPEMLLLDEPTSHLDMGNQMRILHVIKELANGGITVIMASHFPDHAFLVADSAAILNGGTLRGIGTPDEVITEESMRETYGVNVKIVSDGVSRKVCFPELRHSVLPG